MVQSKFLKPANRDLVFNEANAETLIDKMDDFSAIPDEVWFRERNLS